jgi:very-short-patch-repair endonuclease
MTANGNPDRAIERLARTQHGAFNRTQARAAGFSERVIRYRVETGSWLELAPGIYALPSAPPSWRRQYKAAELTHPAAAITQLAAARLQRLDGFRTAAAEIVVPYTSKTRSPIAKVHRGNNVPVTFVDGIRVTTVAQTLFDVMRRVSIDRLERAMDGALLSRAVTIADLQERRDALDLGRRPAIGTWRALVDERSEDGWAPPESDLESTLWSVLKELPGDLGLVRQATMPWWQRGEGRVDVLVPDWRLILEADGRRWHARVRDFDADRWRDNVAASHGYRVLRFTYTHLTERPEEVRSIVTDTGRWRVDAA